MMRMTSDGHHPVEPGASSRPAASSSPTFQKAGVFLESCNRIVSRKSAEVFAWAEIRELKPAHCRIQLPGSTRARKAYWLFASGRSWTTLEREL